MSTTAESKHYLGALNELRTDLYLFRVCVAVLSKFLCVCKTFHWFWFAFASFDDNRLHLWLRESPFLTSRWLAPSGHRKIDFDFGLEFTAQWPPICRESPETCCFPDSSVAPATEFCVCLLCNRSDSQSEANVCYQNKRLELGHKS